MIKNINITSNALQIIKDNGFKVNEVTNPRDMLDKNVVMTFKPRNHKLRFRKKTSKYFK